MATSIDHLTSLAFSLHHGPGQFALLLGSGISRSAGILTGWELTIDLVRKLPGAPKNTDSGELIDWYKKESGKEPAYSELVEDLAKNEVERTNLLRPYFEISEKDTFEGAKKPTSAHKAIARMVSMGLVRVIITTNFDRLMEQALLAEGISPDIVKHESEIAGAMPCVHSKCLLIKVHGDYLDTRLKNTESELSSYPKKLRQYLARILDEHGILTCGWSADYDKALVNIIKSSPNRRFGMYWMFKEPMSEASKEIISDRRGASFQIESADLAFKSLLERVESLQELSKPSPLDVAMLVATAKRYIPREEHRIELTDLVSVELNTAMKILVGEDFFDKRVTSLNTEQQNKIYIEQVKKLEAVAERLCALSAAIVYHGDQNQMKLVVQIVNKLAEFKSKSMLALWQNMSSYPAFLLFYLAGTASIAAGKADMAAYLLKNSFARSYISAVKEPFFKVILGTSILGNEDLSQLLHADNKVIRKLAPVEDHLFEVISSILACVDLNSAEVDLALSKFQYLLQLAYMDFQWRSDEGHVAPRGRYYQSNWKTNQWSDEADIVRLATIAGTEQNAMLEAGFFSNQPERMNEVNNALRKFLLKILQQNVYSF